MGGGGCLAREYLYFSCLVCCIVGRDSSVDIATRYWLFGPVVDSSWRRDFPHPSRPTMVSTQRSAKWVAYLFLRDKAVGAWRWPPIPI
jgi:hypothetical protein